jgi:hypothetical protein
VLSFSDLQTILFEIGNLMNDRPIGIKPKTELDAGQYLCPNDLIMGRCNNRAIPPNSVDHTVSNRVRYVFVQQALDSFWKRWQRDFFPTLIVRKKWHTECRNLCVGDVVLMKDNNALRGVWKMGCVTVADCGQDGKVRDVEICHITLTGMRQVIKRSAHRLVLLLPIEEQ